MVLMIWQLEHLVMNRVGYFAPPMPDVDEPQARQCIEPTITLYIIDPNAFTAGDELKPRALLHISSSFGMRPKVPCGVVTYLVDWSIGCCCCHRTSSAHVVPKSGLVLTV